MNYIDIILAIPLLWAIYRGFTKGLIIEVSSLIALFLGVYGAIHFSYYISDMLKFNSTYSPLISFAITFLIIVIVVFFFAKLLERSVNLLALGFLNKLAGAFFSIIKIAFILSVLLIFINKIDSKISIIPESAKNKSLLFPIVSAFAPTIIPKLNFEEIQKNLTKEKDKPQ
jgi:membrane protein required for colicin V production